ncbi:hypothetical protein A0H81_08559 [Grifola frondosa]|uniref:Mid2 domain-containing protein n=1 Tax=Grifola frondosa TaxID=5627 RepID=A0A1C7M426_GRIFR|nr:hypothetical protein A0H81_08559 [Grifola frondosa]
MVIVSLGDICFRSTLKCQLLSMDSRGLAQREQLDNNNNTFSHCPQQNANYTSTTSGSSTSSSTSLTTSTTSATSQGGSKNIGAIIGGTVGGVAGFVAVLLGAGLLWWRSRQRKDNIVDLGEDYHAVNNVDNFNSAMITPYPDIMIVVKGSVFTSPSSSNAGGSVVPSSSGSAPPSEAPRHQDAGPAFLNRTPSGRLPPAYDDVAQSRDSTVPAMSLPGGGRTK